ncbi:DNA primase, partial [Alloalcanivorax gelatiniphagus]
DPGPPPDWDQPAPPEHQARPSRPRRAPRSGGGLTLVERLVLVLLSHPQVLEERPLPDGLEHLNLAQKDLLIQVAGAAREQPDSPAALLGSAMALDQGEDLSTLLREALKPPMDARVARLYWEDALQHLHTMALEQALEDEQRRPNPDASRLGELIRALADARHRAREASARDR